MQYSLLVFEIVFYNPCDITDGTYKGVVGAGGQAEGGPSLHQATDSSAVFSTDNRDAHKPQYSLRRPLAAA